jgi:hypothetical protein
MNIPDVPKSVVDPSTSSSGLGHSFLARVLRSRRGLIVVAISVVGLGAALNWSWLVTMGAAPLLFGLLPCAAMCALGVCMAGMSARRGGRALADASSDPAARTASADEH